MRQTVTAVFEPHALPAAQRVAQALQQDVRFAPGSVHLLPPQADDLQLQIEIDQPVQLDVARQALVEAGARRLEELLPPPP